MSGKLLHRVPLTADSEVMVANSRFCDDTWDLTPLFSQNSISPNYKKLRFDDIHNEQMKLIVKQYLYYKLGQIKARTVVAVRYRLTHFVRFCEIYSIKSLKHITSHTLIAFAAWLKAEHDISPNTGHFISYAVEEMIRIGQIKGWNVPDCNILTGVTAKDLWGPRADESSAKKIQPIPDDVFDKIMQCAVNYKARNPKDVLTKCGIIIQSQTGLRIGEVLSIKSGCLHQPSDSPAYFEVALSKTVKGDPILHQVFANDLVVSAVMELEQSTAHLREESGKQELFLIRNQGINVPNAFAWSSHRLRTFIRDCDIRGADGKLYPLKSHQFRATFVKQLIMRKIPIAYVMKQYSHVSAEMTCYYLTLQEHEVRGCLKNKYCTRRV